jgi:chromatin assembly factor 1 subunit B
LGKRDARTTSESEREDNKDASNTPAQPQKKRRIAPTLISSGTDSNDGKP